MAEKLREAGFTIELPEHKSPGRPILAKQLQTQTDLSINEIFTKYLVPGTPTYVGRSRPTVEQAIEVIHAAGGVAVWAHPFWDVDDPDEVLRTIVRFAAEGLDGVECFYPEHSREQALLLYETCDARGLLSTGSADFHGPEHEHFSRFRNFSLYGLEPRLGPIGA